jgi:hypothetical protein
VQKDPLLAERKSSRMRWMVDFACVLDWKVEMGMERIFWKWSGTG